MTLMLSLSSLALRQLVDGACTAVGVPDGGTSALAVAVFLKERFTDHSQRLSAALHAANQRAWKALELALVGDSLLERCKAATHGRRTRRSPNKCALSSLRRPCPNKPR